MKKGKLNLSELKVKSFVTDLENGKENTVKGGTGFIDSQTNPFDATQPVILCIPAPGETDFCGGGIGLRTAVTNCPGNCDFE